MAPLRANPQPNPPSSAVLPLSAALIEIPVGSWNGHRFLRVSAHLYTTQADMERLLAALSAVELRQATFGVR
jgi:selenocysteine lyase/cysteine desulfurase